MTPLMIGVYSSVALLIIVLFVLVFKYANWNTKEEVVETVDTLTQIKETLKNHREPSEVIQKAIYRYINMKDLNTASKAQMNEALGMLLLYLKHPHCNAKLFAAVQLDLNKRYPAYKYQFEAIGERALAERNKK